MVKKIGFLLILALAITSCAQPEARKPVTRLTGSFLKESVERNKKLIAQEEKIILDLIRKDSVHKYYASKNGFWYHYEKRDSLQKYTPKKGDSLSYAYNISKFNGDTIYRKTDLGIKSYIVDEQPIISGFRQGLKLMKEGEVVTFLFPSHIAYGYHGDKKKIGTNIPIKATVTLLNIKKKTQKEETKN